MKLSRAKKLFITVSKSKYKLKSYCLKCRKDIENINPNFRILEMIKQWYYQYAICGSKKSRLFKNQEPRGLLSNLGLRTPLSKVPILADILFWMFKIKEIVNKFLLAGNKFIPEMHLKQPGFIYSAWLPLERKKKN